MKRISAGVAVTIAMTLAGWGVWYVVISCGIIQKKLKFDDAYMATTSGQHQYALTLDQSPILAMEDEARWMISNSLTDVKTVPNCPDYLSENGFKAFKPEAVNIIR